MYPTGTPEGFMRPIFGVDVVSGCGDVDFGSGSLHELGVLGGFGGYGVFA